MIAGAKIMAYPRRGLPAKSKIFYSLKVLKILVKSKNKCSEIKRFVEKDTNL